MYKKMKPLLLSFVLLAYTQRAFPASSRNEVNSFNYVLGTQTIGVRYQFTGKTKLVETAEAIHAMGSNILKISMSRRYCGADYGLQKDESIQSLTGLAAQEPSYKKVLDMDFSYYLIWTYCFSGAKWQDGLSEDERKREYRELYEFASHLLTAYKGSGKTFFLGHWEGDWYLHPGYNPRNDPSPVMIQGMIDWLNIRQKAVDDAKRNSASEGVDLYHYTEVNLVQKAMKGGKTLTNNVLPHTSIDFVSYSSYDTCNRVRGDCREELHRALDYIESKLPPKGSIPGKRVFIGEYGVPLEGAKTAGRQELFCRDIALAGLEWGCPFVLYWEMYCNENKKGTHRGFWLINNENEKQPYYYTHKHYYKSCKEFVAETKKKTGKVPTEKQFRRYAVKALKNIKRHDPENTSVSVKKEESKASRVKGPKRLWADSWLWAKAPELHIEKWLNGTPHLKGKYVLIEFWATWCPPCRRTIPLLNSFHNKYKKELAVIGISHEKEEDIRKLWRDRPDTPKIHYFSAIDTRARMKKKLGVFGIPHVIILEPGGYVIWEGFPLLKDHELTEGIIEKILEAGKSRKKPPTED